MSRRKTNAGLREQRHDTSSLSLHTVGSHACVSTLTLEEARTRGIPTEPKALRRSLANEHAPSHAIIPRPPSVTPPPLPPGSPPEIKQKAYRHQAVQCEDTRGNDWLVSVQALAKASAAYQNYAQLEKESERLAKLLARRAPSMQPSIFPKPLQAYQTELTRQLESASLEVGDAVLEWQNSGLWSSIQTGSVRVDASPSTIKLESVLSEVHGLAAQLAGVQRSAEDPTGVRQSESDIEEGEVRSILQAEDASSPDKTNDGLDVDHVTTRMDELDVSAKSRAIVDRVSIMEFRARLLSKHGQTEDAEHTWKALIDQNPDHYGYYKGFFSNRGIDLDNITDEHRPQALQALRDFSSQIPRAAAPRRLALAVATGDEFKELAEPYLATGLSKNIPSLFADVKSLYRDPFKLEVIASLAEARHSKLKAETSSSEEPPTTYLWTLYFLAQHYSHVGQHARALELLDEALSHTPTLPDLLMFKGRVLKRLGDPFGAARCMDEARVLDLQDRFLNTKCGKYRLRAGMNEEAQEIFGLFTKKDAPSPAADLEDMQSVLFLLEDADAHRRNGNLAMALKRYTSIQKLFDEFEDDQFDFHGYSLRKFTINIYLNMIEWADHLRSHPAYVRAAIAASQIHVQIHDDPTLVARLGSDAQLSEEEKKAKKKAKKAASKAQEDPKKAAAGSANEDKGLDASPPKDDDPDGKKLVQASDRLERAAKFLNPLTTHAAHNVDAWLAIYDVAIRRKKYLQAVQALNRAQALDADHPGLHLRLVHLKKTVSSLPQEPPAPIGPVLSQAVSKLLPSDVALDTFNSQYLQKHPGSPQASLAFAKALRILDAPLQEIESTLLNLTHPEANLDIKTALDVLAFLREISSSRVDEFRTACDSKFERSTIFKTPQEMAALRKKAVAPPPDESTTANGDDKTEVIS